MSNKSKETVKLHKDAKEHTGRQRHKHWTIIVAFAVLAIGLTYMLAVKTYIPLRSSLVSLSLLVDKQEFSVNDLIEVTIYLDNGFKKSSGVDVVMQYDPSFLEIKPLKRNELTGAVIAGNAILDSQQKEIKVNPHDYLNTQISSFDTFPYMKADTSSGIVVFSALAKPYIEIQGKVPVASLTFRAVSKGNTKINLVFNGGSATDSNVAYLGRDILEEVHGIDLRVQ